VREGGELADVEVEGGASHKYSIDPFPPQSLGRISRESESNSKRETAEVARGACHFILIKGLERSHRLLSAI